MTPASAQQRALFMADLAPAAAAVCPGYGMDPAQCVAQAEQLSGAGRYCVGYNYWNLQGVGDAGCYYAVVALPTGEAAGGGCRPVVSQRAKFTTPAVAAAAWCQSQGQEEQP